MMHSTPTSAASKGAAVTGSDFRPLGSSKVRRSDLAFALTILGPALTLIGVLLVVPLMLLLVISFKAMKLGSLAQIFSAPITIDNYVRVLTDSATWTGLGISVAYIVGSSAIAFVLGLTTALLLNEKFPAQRLFRTLILIPWAVPGVTATIAFLWIMQPSFGVLNYGLRILGLTEHDISWFADPRLALIAVIMPTVWKTYPFFTIMLLAALQTIQRELYESASIDGANSWGRFRWITWPGIQRYAVVSLVFNAMYVFKEFDFIFASTKGGPQGATSTIAIRIYNLAFESFDLSSAAALGVVTFVLVSVCVYIFVRWQMRTEIY